jgi:hypothetical protein
MPRKLSFEDAQHIRILLRCEYERIAVARAYDCSPENIDLIGQFKTHTGNSIRRSDRMFTDAQVRQIRSLAGDKTPEEKIRLQMMQVMNRNIGRGTVHQVITRKTYQDVE